MPELAAPLRRRSDHDPPLSERVPHPSGGQASPPIIRDTFCPAKCTISCIRYLAKAHFVRDLLQIPTVEVWKRSFRSRLPSNSNGWSMRTKLSCEISINSKNVQALKTKLSCETSFQFQMFKHWKGSFRARFPSNCNGWSMKTTLSCEISLKFQTLSQTFRHADFQTFRHWNFPTSRLSDIQTFRHWNFPTSRLSEHPDFQTSRLSDIEAFRHPDFQNSDFRTF